MAVRAILQAVGGAGSATLRFVLMVDNRVLLGRSPRSGWAVPWDHRISREHAELLWSGEELQVNCLETARNPLTYFGAPTRTLRVQPGESFGIGDTTFHLQADQAEAPPIADFTEHAFSRSELERIDYVDAARRMALLSRLPAILGARGTEAEIAAQVAELLVQAVSAAEFCAVVEPPADGSQAEPPRTVSWTARKESTRLSVSRTLVKSAIERGCSVVHVWEDREEGAFTRVSGIDWALCTALPSETGRWCLYVAGRFRLSGLERRIASTDDLREEAKFVELVAEFVGSYWTSRNLQSRETRLGEYFSPAVMEALRRGDGEQSLAPREMNVTVLFCDMRGFSKAVEGARHALEDLLQRVTSALGIMTREIVKHDGIIADFQGDAALAFWGWPAAAGDGPLAACRAALQIAAEFRANADQPDHPLAGFRVGIGIAHGPAIAGKIGTRQQAKIGVFGPTVNLGARLEGLTKQLRVPILIDEVTAETALRGLSSEEGRLRRLARLRPAGLLTPLWCFELAPPDDETSGSPPAWHADYQAAAAAVAESRWDEARRLLANCPAHDGPTHFLTAFLQRCGATPPAGWDGAITLSNK